MCFQLPAFARRSSILANFQDSSQDEENQIKLESIPMHRSQPQQYQLNSKKHHQYLPNTQEVSEPHVHSKKKYFYQLNSKKHHHYQPDPKMYDVQFAKVKETKPQGPPSQSWNPPPSLQQKWVRDKDTGCLSKVKDLIVEPKKPSANSGQLEQRPNTSPKEGSLPSAISSKMKIIKNKNKNGRIIIVMSKYMDNKVSSTDLANGDSVRSPCQGGELEDSGTDHSPEQAKVTNHPNQEDSILEKDCRSLSVDYKKAKSFKEHRLSKERNTDQDNCGLHMSESLFGTKVDQPLQLTNKTSPLTSALLEVSRCHSLSNERKRTLSEPVEQESDSKRFLCSRSTSAPCTVASPYQSEPMNLHLGDQTTANSYSEFTDANPEEPIDLSFWKSPKQVEPPAGGSASDQQSAESLKRPEETVSHFKPFQGNIVITDITTNCLTVTFKEYVTM